MAYIKLPAASLLLSIFVLLMSTSIALAEPTEVYRHLFTNTKGYSVAVDQQGNVVVTGGFEGTIDFDPGSNVFNVTSLSGDDAFTAKYDAAGNFLWVRTIAGTYTERGLAIGVDNAGNIYVTGTIDGTNTFLAKYTADGVLVWQGIIGTTAHPESDLFVDASGNLYLTDYFGTIPVVDFDPGPGVFNLTATRGSIYFAKFDTNGNLIWAKQLGEEGSAINTYALTVSAAGTIYLAGSFRYEMDFDPSDNVSSFYDPYTNMFVAIYNNEGDFIHAWMSSSVPGTCACDYVYADAIGIGIDNTGNIYVSGRFTGNVDFDPSDETVTFSSSTANIFLLRFDSVGNLIWARYVAGASGVSSDDLAIDSMGNLYVIGVFDGTVDFDPGVGVFNLTQIGRGSDFYAASYTNNGEFRWAQRTAGPVFGDPSQISLYNDTEIYITGYTASVQPVIYQAYLIHLFQPDEPEATITENEFYAAFETQRTNYPEIAQGLADFAPGQINLTVRLIDGTVGVVNVAFDSSEGLVTMRITSMSVNGSSNVPPYFRDTINRNLLQLIAETLDALVIERFGVLMNVETITITDSALEINLGA